MTDWTSGYVTEINYTHGYYHELNPQRARLAFLNSGYEFPQVESACELAFGQGVSVNIHAAAGRAKWWGNDFMPAQAAAAQELAAASGSAADLSDESFADFCKRDDLPEFDYIALHGIFSWITADNQAIIEDFIRRKLRVGGVLYISYNTFPGWAPVLPLRHLLAEHSDVMGARGKGVISRLGASLEFVDKMIEAKPLYFGANPQLAERFKRMKGMDKHYLAHEYFNQNWEPMFFSDMARRLSSIKLNYVCSANPTDHIDSVNLTGEHQAFLKEIIDPIFKETVRDYLINQQFRRDYWVKGPRRLSLTQQSERWMKQSFMLTALRPSITMKLTGSLGEASLQEALYTPVLDAMADYQPRTVAQLMEQSKVASLGQMAQILMVLVGKGVVHPVQAEADISAAKAKARKLNEYVLRQALDRGEITYLASPVIGGGVQIARIQQLFLLALSQGRKQPAEWAAYATDILFKLGHKLIKDGKPMETREENLAQITSNAEEFSKTLPILKALQVI